MAEATLKDESLTQEELITEQAAPKTFRQYLKFMGPAAIATVVVMGPGTMSDMVRGGALLGPGIGWIALFSALTSWWFMALANKTTCLTGDPPLEMLYKFWKPLAAAGALLWFLPQIFIVMIQGVGCAQTGAAATGIAPSIIIWPILIACTFVFFLGKFKSLEKIAALFVFLLCIISLVFFGRLLMGPELAIGEVLRGLLVPSWPNHPETAVLFAGAVGGAGTWGILAFQGYAVKQAGNAKPSMLWVSQMDAFFMGGVMVALFSAGMLFVAAGVFFPQGIVPDTAPQAAELFVPFLGKWAFPVFYAGFLGACFATLAGTNILLSTCIFAVLNVYKVGNIDWRPQLDNKNFRIFNIVTLFVVAGLGSLPGGEAILPALIWSLSLATFISPPGFAIWIYFTNCKKYVGDKKNSWYWNVGLVIMLVTLTYLAIAAFPGLIRNPFSF